MSDDRQKQGTEEQKLSGTQQKILNECRELAKLLISKNNDYGSAALASPVLIPGMDQQTTILIRMSDKINRIRTLFSNECIVQVKEETVSDTIRDLAGYCILWLISDQDKNKTLARGA